MTYTIEWFDNSNLPLDQKILKAAEYFQHTTGRMPNICLVNPNAGTADIPGLTLRYRLLAPDHIKIGYEEMPAAEQE